MDRSILGASTSHRAPLASRLPAPNAAPAVRSSRSRSAQLAGIKGAAVYEDDSGKATKGKSDIVKSGPGKDESLIAKKLKALEKRVECNAQVNRDRFTSLDDRLTQIHLQLHSQASLSSSTNAATLSTPTKANPGTGPSAVLEGMKSPPVPALQKKMDTYVEWERSMISGDLTLSGIDDVQEEEDDGEAVQRGNEELEEMREKMTQQQNQIDALVAQNAQQAEQIAYLISHFSQSQQTIETLQFDMAVEQGKFADMESRLEAMVEEADDVRDASLLIDTAPEVDDMTVDEPDTFHKRKVEEEDDEVPSKRVSL
ncbi:hypothetical protein L202_08394 [Cryptococcus amylolentus CBS 6039]|uniref:Uncharacterized protein n=2 Tax=Cryptococcus amylolentus TaxID=104669 RepID=A0A1E3H9I1_9TREE|nr:hypothetical protein L202_08394 [Cryptococcus amylolentus CBS 6039]ODN72997.1 hypothetical protein L202_08394 [Cryptococcus amylolentus CBS 6039]ODN98154.1 hypothetical protein I350_07798 [Cryptococcus amylolentus CBS 6273]